ncbi:hypothetical protein L6164_009194 [Bauhinia variegata]|nr:hypothetical protein L6164_009194 [Bauhinia variegata]
MNVKEEDIRKIFEKMGETVRLTLVRVDLTGTNDGYALVRYSSADDARGVLDKYTKVEICGRKYATAPVEGSILIYNIDKKWKNEDVIKLLKETGTEGIEKVSLVVDPDNVGHNLGYGFVELQTCKDAQNAFDCKNLQRKLDKLQKCCFLLLGFNKPNQPRNNRKTPGKSHRRRRSDIMDYKTAVAVQSIRQQAHWMRWQKRFGSGPVVALQPHMLPTWNHPFPARAGGYHTYSYHPGYINMHPSYPQRGYNPLPADSRGYNDHRRPARSFSGSSSSANNPRGDGLLARPNTYHRQGDFD